MIKMIRYIYDDKYMNICDCCWNVSYNYKKLVFRSRLVEKIPGPFEIMYLLVFRRDQNDTCNY